MQTKSDFCCLYDFNAKYISCLFCRTCNFDFLNLLKMMKHIHTFLNWNWMQNDSAHFLRVFSCRKDTIWKAGNCRSRSYLSCLLSCIQWSSVQLISKCHIFLLPVFLNILSLSSSLFRRYNPVDFLRRCQQEKIDIQGYFMSWYKAPKFWNRSFLLSSLMWIN